MLLAVPTRLHPAEQNPTQEDNYFFTSETSGSLHHFVWEDGSLALPNSLEGLWTVKILVFYPMVCDSTGVHFTPVAGHTDRKGSCKAH